MYVPSRLAPEPFPLPLATNRVRPSDDVATAVGYQPAGMSPATRMPVRPIRTTATALFPAIATYSVRPSGESASALGSLPVAAWGDRATASCSTTVPVRRSTRATALAPASAAYRSVPRSASAEGCGPTESVVRRTAGPADTSITLTVESPQSLTYRCIESATAPYGRRPTPPAPRRARVAAAVRETEAVWLPA